MNYKRKFIKYSLKISELILNMIGSGRKTIVTSDEQLQAKVLKKLNGDKINKKEINSIKNTDAGVNIIGVRDDKLQILVSYEYRYSSDAGMEHQISTFGGKHEEGETILETAIRETIEEIFNIKPKSKAVADICEFITGDTYNECYYIVKTIGQNEKPYYSYIFDVNILGKILDSLIKNDQHTFPRMPSFYLEEPFDNKKFSHTMLNFNNYILPSTIPSGLPRIRIEELIYDRKMADKILEKLSNWRLVSKLMYTKDKLGEEYEIKLRNTKLFGQDTEIDHIEKIKTWT